MGAWQKSQVFIHLYRLLCMNFEKEFSLTLFTSCYYEHRKYFVVVATFANHQINYTTSVPALGQLKCRQTVGISKQNSVNLLFSKLLNMSTTSLQYFTCRVDNDKLSMKVQTCGYHLFVYHFPETVETLMIPSPNFLAYCFSTS